MLPPVAVLPRAFLSILTRSLLFLVISLHNCVIVLMSSLAREPPLRLVEAQKDESDTPMAKEVPNKMRVLTDCYS